MHGSVLVHRGRLSAGSTHFERVIPLESFPNTKDFGPEVGGYMRMLMNACGVSDTKLAQLGKISLEMVRKLGDADGPFISGKFVLACSKHTGLDPYVIVGGRTPEKTPRPVSVFDPKPDIPHSRNLLELLQSNGHFQAEVLSRVTSVLERPPESKEPIVVASAAPVIHDALEHGSRIVMLYEVCGVPLEGGQRALILGECGDGVIPNQLLERMAAEIHLHPEVLLGKRHFNRDQSPVRQGTQWESPPSPFVPGNGHVGNIWKLMLMKYRAVRRAFCEAYSLDESLIERIGRGEMGVPVPVHLTLMRMVDERLTGVADPVLPRAYDRLQRLRAHIPLTLQGVVGKVYPCTDWFSSRS